MSKRFLSIFAILILAGLVAMGAYIGVSFADRSSEKAATTSVGDSELTSPGFYENTTDSSKAVLSVKGMSCSGCVFTIKSSLSKLKGIDEVLVDISAGKAEVYFDKRELKDVDQIAAAITASGYAASIDKVVTAEQLKKELDLMATRSRMYIASVGGLDISRNDFFVELEGAKRRYSRTYGEGIFSTDRGKKLHDSLRGQILSRLIDESIQMQEIQKAGFKVDKASVDKEFHRFLSERGMKAEEFKAALEKDGYSFETFMKRFKAQVLVKQYLDLEVFPGVSNDVEKQQRYADWFNNAKLLAKVVYYDKSLESLAKSQSSGCGSSCSTKGKK